MLTSMYFSHNTIMIFILLFVNGTRHYYTERYTDGYPTLSLTGPTCLIVVLVTPHVAPPPPAVAQVRMLVEFSLQIARHFISVKL